MVDPPNRHLFWDREAPTARFSHPLNEAWLARVVERDSPILDYGCGYGRTLAELKNLGYADLTGIDVSEAMLERARSEVGDVRFIHLDGAAPTPLPAESFELVILFAVLTSIPEDDLQRALISDAARVLRAGGHLYVSDMPLQTDGRRVTRYREARPAGLPYGTFEIEGGRVIMRHHSDDWFDELFAAFNEVDRRVITVATMRGRTAEAVQYLLRKPPR